jgi:hypothetical protein
VYHRGLGRGSLFYKGSHFYVRVHFSTCEESYYYDRGVNILYKIMPGSLFYGGHFTTLHRQRIDMACIRCLRAFFRSNILLDLTSVRLWKYRNWNSASLNLMQ